MSLACRYAWYDARDVRHQCLAVDTKHGENQFDIEEFIQ
jgi:hypothetical protein